MSKLYKDLNYDTDRVMQPGDPISSPDGMTEVRANDNGTATLSHMVQPSGLNPPLIEFNNFSGYTGSVQMKGPFTTQEGWYGYVENSAPDPTDMSGFMSGWVIVAPSSSFMDHPMLWIDSNEVNVLIFDIDTASPIAKSYGDSPQPIESITITRSTPSPVVTTERILTESDFGDIASVLDAINGEVV